MYGLHEFSSACDNGFAFLPTVAGIEAAGEDGLLTGQVEIFTLIAVRQRFGDEQLVLSLIHI